MPRLGVPHFILALISCMALSVYCSVNLQAQDTDKDAPAAEEKAEKDIFKVPADASAEELLTFMKDLQKNAPPRPRTMAQLKSYQEFMKKAQPAFAEAAEKILAKDPPKDSDAYKAAIGLVIQSKINKLRSAPKAEKIEIADYLLDFLKNKKEKSPSDAQLGILVGRALLDAGEKERAVKILKENTETVIDSFKDNDNINPRDTQLATSIVGMLEDAGQKDLAKKANEQFSKVFLASDNKLIQGIGRRIGLLGNKLEVLTGTTLDGEEFKWDDFKGKVVLIDFWATWCGPCRAEIPNVLKMYEAYHDKGFEVVGISLDRSIEPLEKYLDKEKLPWTQLFQKEGRNEMAQYYGVVGIPTVILVDQKGKVVSLNARGSKLGQELEKLLGPVEK